MARAAGGASSTSSALALTTTAAGLGAATAAALWLASRCVSYWHHLRKVRAYVRACVRALPFCSLPSISRSTPPQLVATCTITPFNPQQARGLPQVHQFVSYFSLLQAVLPKRRYSRAFFKEAVPLFAALDTPLFAFVSSGYLGIHINDAHLFREVRPGQLISIQFNRRLTSCLSDRKF